MRPYIDDNNRPRAANAISAVRLGRRKLRSVRKSSRYSASGPACGSIGMGLTFTIVMRS